MHMNPKGWILSFVRQQVWQRPGHLAFIIWLDALEAFSYKHLMIHNVN